MEEGIKDGLVTFSKTSGNWTAYEKIYEGGKTTKYAKECQKNGLEYFNFKIATQQSDRNESYEGTFVAPAAQILVVDDSHTTRILQTIISRVKQIELDEIPSEKISKLLIDSGIDKASPEISQFTHNAGCIKFVIKRKIDVTVVKLLKRLGFAAKFY